MEDASPVAMTRRAVESGAANMSTHTSEPYAPSVKTRDACSTSAATKPAHSVAISTPPPSRMAFTVVRTPGVSRGMSRSDAAA